MESDHELVAFKRVEFHSVFDPEQVWEDRPVGHVALHQSALDRFRDSLDRATHLKNGRHPLGLCFIGPAGSGKTHLLGEVRRESAALGANFVMNDLTDLREFWPLLAMHFLKSIQKPMNGVRQMQRILDVLVPQAKDPRAVEEFLERGRFMHREELVSLSKDVIASLIPICDREIRRHHRVFRGLMYLESADIELSDRAYSFLQGIEQNEDQVSKVLGLDGKNSAQSVVEGLAWLLSLVGPTVLALDQLDPFVAQNNLINFDQPKTARLAEAENILGGAISGIMSLRLCCPRTLVVITCLESSWKVLEKRAVSAFPDRFEPIELLHQITDTNTPFELVAKRLDEAYQSADFKPPYRTWPFAPGFFKTMPKSLSPREILVRCAKHRLDCIRAGEVSELHRYADGIELLPLLSPPPPMDKLFTELRAAADPVALLNENQEDLVGDLLRRAAQLLKTELPFDSEIDIAVHTDFHETKRYASLHFRLLRIFHSEGEREEHVCVRALLKSHATSFQVRLTAATTISGMSEKLDGRHLFLLRNSAIPSGPRTREIVDQASLSEPASSTLTPTTSALSLPSSRCQSGTTPSSTPGCCGAAPLAQQSSFGSWYQRGSMLPSQR